MDENPILEHFNAPYHRGPVLTATHTGYARIPACGDEVTLYLEIHKEIITEVGFVARGCMVSQAASSMLCAFINGKCIQELDAFTPEKMLQLMGIPLTPRRQLCGLLPFLALQKLVPSGLNP